MKQVEEHRTKKEIIKMFNHCFNKACQNEMILGRPFQEIYSPSLQAIDFGELDPYFPLAENYAKTILQNANTEIEKAYYKKVKRI